MKKFNKLKLWQKILCFLGITIFIEVFVFNMRFFQSIGYKKELVLSNKYTTSSGTLLLKNINKHVSNIEIILDDSNEDLYYQLNLYGTDEANKDLFSLGSVMISPTNKRSYYHTLHLSGKTDTIELSFKTKLKVSKVYINANVPFMFSFFRVIFMFAIIMLVYLLRPSSKLYKIKALEDDNGKIAAVICSSVMALLSIWFISQNTYFLSIDTDPVITLSNQREYHKLTHALANGHLYMDEKPGEVLNSLSNPYDYNYRRNSLYRYGETYLWDFAYYKGKYYVYFGIAPVIIFYLPYYLITGEDLPNYKVDEILIILEIIGIGCLIYTICKKWFKNVNLGTFIIGLIIAYLSFGVLNVAKRPDFYYIPIIMAMVFTTYGLTLFISALDGKHFKLKIAIGSTLLALTALSRPQFLLASFLIIPLYFDYFFKNKDKSKRALAKEFMCILIPYLIVGGITCAYNYARFGNILDFGANYNLTTNDMTHRGVVLDRIPLGLFYYLIAFPHIKPEFPFISRFDIESTYLGYTTFEKLTGGFFITHFITILGLFTFKYKNYFKDKKLYRFNITLVVFALLVIIADTEMAGILPRYYLDFAWYFTLASIIMLFALNEHIKNKSPYRKVLLLNIVCMILFEFFTAFVGPNAQVKDLVPNYYYYFYYLFDI